MNRKSSSAEMEKLENMKIVELREYAKNLGLKGVSKLKKQELIEAVSDFIENEKLFNMGQPASGNRVAKGKFYCYYVVI